MEKRVEQKKNNSEMKLKIQKTVSLWWALMAGVVRQQTKLSNCNGKFLMFKGYLWGRAVYRQLRPWDDKNKKVLPAPC